MFGEGDYDGGKMETRTSTSPSASSSDHSDMSEDEAPGDTGKAEPIDISRATPVKKSVSRSNWRSIF